MLSVTEKIKKIEEALVLDNHRFERVSCKEAELTELMQAQKVTCLPEIYRQLMLTGLIGFLVADVSPQALLHEDMKAMLIEDLEEDRISYPQDIFVFGGFNGDHFLCLRTQPCEEDPPVYGYRGEGYFQKLANALSEMFPGSTVAEPEQRVTLTTEDYGHHTDYYYDPDADQFYGVPSPSYDEIWPIEKLIEKLTARYGEELEGCTEAELEELMQAQNVACLPQAYRQLMVLMGKYGMRYVLEHERYTSCDPLKSAKALLISKLDRRGISYPPDIFVLYNFEEMGFHFFRTQDCRDDPPVFSYRNGSFYKLADSVAQLVLQGLDPSISRQGERLRRIYKVEFYYDTEKDIFLPCSV